MKNLYTIKIEKKEVSKVRKVTKDQFKILFAARKVAQASFKFKGPSSNLLVSYDYATREMRDIRKALKVEAKPQRLIIVSRKFGDKTLNSSFYWGQGSLKAAKEGINNQIKEYRSASKVLRKTARYTNDGNIPYTVIAGCFYEPGTITTLLKRKGYKKIFDPKVPSDLANHVGIELEFFAPVEREELGAMLFEAGISKNVCLKDDGSIRPDNGSHSYEACVVASESIYKEVIKKVTNILSNVNAKVNKSCGMHVHLDARNRNKEIMFSNLVSSQSILFSMVPKSRRENSYCKKNASKAYSSSGSRYQAINGAAYPRHKTIEVRLHSGTVSYDKIVNWVDLLISIVSKADEIKRGASSLNGFVKQYNLSNDMRNYIATRIALFNEATEEGANREEVS